jgi:hypothetical protein
MTEYWKGSVDGAYVYLLLNTKNFALAINNEQKPEWSENKVLVHIFHDAKCRIPVIDRATGKPLVCLKRATVLLPFDFYYE